jgi:hypothetical protein
LDSIALPTYLQWPYNCKRQFNPIYPKAAGYGMMLPKTKEKNLGVWGRCCFYAFLKAYQL